MEIVPLRSESLLLLRRPHPDYPCLLLEYDNLPSLRRGDRVALTCGGRIEATAEVLRVSRMFGRQTWGVWMSREPE